MKTLDLFLCYQWYDMIDQGEKPEEYREDTAYWTKRLCKYGKVKRGFGKQNICFADCNCKLNKCYNHVPTDIEAIRFHRGYTQTTMTFELKQIRYDYGKVKWGAPKDRKVFCLMLGRRIGMFEQIDFKKGRIYP